MYEAHFAIPMSGAIINTINVRLDAKTIYYIINHSKTKLIFVDSEFLPLLRSALKFGKKKIDIVTIDDDKRFSKNIKEKIFQKKLQLKMNGSL